MPITALPPAPSRADPPATFVAKADAFVAALQQLVTEMNAAVGVANVTKWISGTTYAIGDVTWSPADFQAYRRKTAGAGATDPSADTANWQRTEVSGTSLQAQSYTAFTSAGTAPAYTLTPSPALTAYAANQRFRVAFHAAGTTGSNTLNVSGKGAVNLKQYDASGTKVAGVVAAGLFDVEYDGTDFVILDPLPASMTGMIVGFPATTAPAGWIKANGATLSRATYAALWAYAQSSGNLAATEGGKLLGQFGPGNGSTTFSIPDVRGEFTRWLDDGRGVDAGRGIGTAQTDDFKSHTHTGGMDSTQNLIGGSSGAFVHLNTQPLPPTGAAGGTETRPRNVAMLACIKY